jgi:hypothetical protein
VNKKSFRLITVPFFSMAPRGQTVYVILAVFYYDPQKVSGFLDSIARGFITSPLQYALFAGLILLLVAGLILAYRVQRGRARRLEARLALERFERLAGKLRLTAAELEALDRLAGGQVARKLRLLSSPAAFNRAAARLGAAAQEATGEATLAELRLKLGFQARNPERAPSASSELPEGLPVLLAWSAAAGGLRAASSGLRAASSGLRPAGGRRRLAAEVGAQEAEALVLVPREGAAGPPAGSPVTVVFQNRAGLFSFNTKVRSAAGGVLRLEQVERLQRTQRRKYYRRRLRLPVQVLLREGEPPLPSQLLDLGGDGASLVNPQKSLSAGDLPELAFRMGRESFRLTAEVLRVSRDGRVLHVRFHGLRDADRDRLLGILFRGLGEAAR